MTDTLIEIEGLTTCYGTQVIHRDLSLTVRRGEALTLIGGSGGGKTTLLRQMLGLQRPAAGTVKVFGVPLHAADERTAARLRTRWGVLFQLGALFSALSVFDNVAVPLRELKTLDEDLIADLVWLKLGMVGMGPEHGDKLPAELSGGMVKRVALARALALEPELLFLDEPTAGLDPDRTASLVELICTLRRALDLTLVLITHDVDTLLAVSDRIAVLYEGRLLAVGPVPEVIETDHPFIRDFFRNQRGRPLPASAACAAPA